jgi:hypothetical protein
VPLSLKAVKASVENKPKAENKPAGATDQPAADSITPGQLSPFSLEQLQQHWNAFFVELKAKGSPIELLLAGVGLELKEDYAISVVMNSSLQEEPFERLKPRLQQYLRQRLQNSRLSLHPTITEDNGPRRLYTNSEKFQHLLARYPLLNELKEKLGLEADF